MDLGQYVAALRKRWLLSLALMALGAVGAFGVARSTPPSYQATAKVFVSLSSADSPGELVQGSTYIKNVVESYAALANLPVVLDPIIEDLGLDTSAKSLSTSIAADSPLNTNIIDIQATSGDPQMASRLANAVARQLSTAVTELSPTNGTTRQGVTVNVVAPAAVPTFASAPRTKIMVLTGAGLGLALGMALSLALAFLDTRVRDPRDVESLQETAAVLGTIPMQPRRKHTPLATLVDPLSPRSEAYRRLQTNLSYIDASSPLQVIVVTSATLGEGKTSTAVNLAIALGETSRRVLLIDGDLRRPSVAASMGLEGAAGLTTVLIGRADVADVVQPMGRMHVDVLASGEVPPNPHQLVESDAMRRVVEQARQRYDVIVIDAPPVLPVSDAAVLSRLADAALVVVGCKRVRRSDVRDALRDLTAVGARIAGLVVTFAPESESTNQYYGDRPSRVSTITRRLRHRFRPDEDSSRAEVMRRLTRDGPEDSETSQTPSTRAEARQAAAKDAERKPGQLMANHGERPPRTGEPTDAGPVERPTAAHLEMAARTSSREHR
ncbi:capsular exopolysaccharide synthesis family protein [Terracoccus luteus]|uniref:non-specific protein-tyrosine kinase n=1 Tax=Terracoccus luteus TaxID=53356 RepID=A0A495Y0I3_9MICO|nr:polysaccharide biosynthesis tyrosine autokinase [Terracoccus luteus]RKT78476.1 capsular exopolysaccharide synthesis family protein [Terracoccus luteus]